MSTILYIYDQLWVARTQVFDATSFDCKNKLNTYGTASFEIPYNHNENTELNLRPYNEIKINYLTDSWEQTYIHGIIESVEAWLESTTVNIKSFEVIFERKVIDTAKSYSSWTVDAIVADLLSNVNGRYDTGITLDCGITDTIDLSVSKGATFASALSELVALWYQYRVVNKVLEVKSMIGSDKSTGVNLVELKRDINDPQDRNISNAKIKLDGAQIVNAPFHSTGWFDTDATSIGTFGRIEKTIVPDGSVSVALADTLAKQKDLVKVIEVTPIVDDFFFAEVGDILKLTIDAGNDIMQYSGSVNVLQKTIDSRGVVRVTVSSTTVISPTFIETVIQHGKEIEKLKNT